MKTKEQDQKLGRDQQDNTVKGFNFLVIFPWILMAVLLIWLKIFTLHSIISFGYT